MILQLSMLNTYICHILVQKTFSFFAQNIFAKKGLFQGKK